MSQLLRQVERRIVPTSKLVREKEGIVKKVMGLAEKEAGKHPEVVGVELGGSFAKGTWLAERADIDVFIKFRTDVEPRRFADLGKRIGFSVLRDYKPYVRYAEHPFVEAKVGDTKVNLVPCYDVEKGAWRSSADRSPFHTEFMVKSLTGQMRNEVRLLKWFLKCNGIYGAEIARQGFSGYVCEVLVFSFGTFEGVLRAVSQLKQDQIVGHSSKEFKSPVVIIDPIDPNRNLGAAISAENLGRFVLLARSFLKKPSMRFFKQAKTKIASRAAFRNVLVVKFRYEKRSPDVIWGQLKRAASSVATQIDQEGFTVLRRSAFIMEDEAFLLFLLQSVQLDKTRLRVGPDFFVEDHVDRFVSSNRKKSLLMWVNEEGKICSLQKRAHQDAMLFVKELLRKNLKRSGVSAGLHNDIKRFSIIRGDKVSGKSIKEAIAELVSTDEAAFSSN